MENMPEPTFGPTTQPPNPAPEPAQPPPVDYGGVPSQPEPVQSTPPPKPKSGKNWLLISLIAVLIIIILGAAYWLLIKSKPATSTKTSTSQTAKTAEPAAAAVIDATTKPYSSTNFNLIFAYPADWTVTDTGSGIMTVKSPTTQLKGATGATVAGQIVLTLRNTTQKLAEFNGGNATATRDSLKIAYAKPTPTQRANTYISFLQYATTTTTGALDGVYITGDSGYQKAGAIPLVDVQKIDPIISITFVNSAGAPISIADSAWDTTSFSGPLTTMLESFSIN